jgi:murein DD-endopeptidase MepM/ murein hydrolase activator NlpD
VKKFLTLIAVAIMMLAGLPAVASASPDSHGGGGNTSCTAATTAPTPVAQDQLQPFLKLPFKKSDGKNSAIISNGYKMAANEIPIAGPDDHTALDFEFTKQKDHGYGLPILAADDGRAYFSYQYLSGSWTDAQGVAHQIGVGGGLFVEVRHCNGWVTQSLHLSKVANVATAPPTNHELIYQCLLRRTSYSWHSQLIRKVCV